VQCRLRNPFVDIYVDALSQLNISVQVKEAHQGVFKAHLSASGEIGFKLLAKVGLSGSAEQEWTAGAESKSVGHDVNDLRYVADYRVFVIIIGVWSDTNLLLHLNPDLTGRVIEIPIDWTDVDLKRILTKGGSALHIDFDSAICEELVGLSYANAGLLQQLTMLTLDDAGIDEGGGLLSRKRVSGIDHVTNGSMDYAEQLNPVYQQFAKRVAAGMRTRSNATGIYAHAMAIIMDADDDELIKGLHARRIFDRAVKRQPRIQYGNLKAILDKLPSLQVDEDGRGLILGYSSATEEITIVDRQMLLYRRYSTVKWPWEDLIVEADAAGGKLEDA
jgi:hypothetical protein